jgi:hypothetical protein
MLAQAAWPSAIGRQLPHLVPGHAQLVLHVDLRRGDKGVHAGALGMAHCLPGALQVSEACAAEATDDWHVAVFMDLVANLHCNGTHSLKVVCADR